MAAEPTTETEAPVGVEQHCGARADGRPGIVCERRLGHVRSDDAEDWHEGHVDDHLSSVTPAVEIFTETHQTIRWRPIALEIPGELDRVLAERHPAGGK